MWSKEPRRAGHTTKVPEQVKHNLSRALLAVQLRCDGWAVRGECGMNPGFMHRTCRAACGLCRPDAGNQVMRCARGTLTI